MITPKYDKRGVMIYHGDSVEVMRAMPDNSVDSIVTDPPYGIRFMGKAWDGADIEKQTATRRKYGDGPSPTGGHNSTAANAGLYNLSLSANQAFAEWTRVWSVEALRILKPGGHMLVFCGPRTYHRMASGVEDAGFEIRDQIMWIYGSGFPKSLDVSKAIDKAAGAEREVVGTSKYEGRRPNKFGGNKNGDNAYGDYNAQPEMPITTPATDAAKQWDGWGTALKPAHEPIVVARKPIEGTVAENVLQHGTGGLNIDGGRIGTDEKWEGRDMPDAEDGVTWGGNLNSSSSSSHELGRFPANIILDPEAAEILDKQSGYLTSGNMAGGTVRAAQDEPGSVCYGTYGGNATALDTPGDSGGASRFFYCAKASKQDRDEGLEGMEVKRKSHMQTANGTGKASMKEGFPDTFRANHHPTVKPTVLMQYLVRLVTPPGGTILDPFMGSGSTGKAAVREGFKFIGCEREAEYIPISIARINAPAQVSLI